MEQNSPKSPRFSDTPPGSPKSCMKGSRKLTFDNPSDVVVGTGGNPTPIPSPKKSPKSKSVSIRTHDDGRSGGGEASPRVTSFDLSSSEKKQMSKAPPPAEIQFQFELTEHFDQSTPPPNCTSNGNYDFDQEQQQQTTSPNDQQNDPRKDPQLVEIATKFVNDIIETAKQEAADRSKAEATKEKPSGTSDREQRDSFSAGMGRGAATWVRRAHGMVSKWITNICVRAQNIRADLK